MILKIDCVSIITFCALQGLRPCKSALAPNFHFVMSLRAFFPGTARQGRCAKQSLSLLEEIASKEEHRLAMTSFTYISSIKILLVMFNPSTVVFRPTLTVKLWS